MNYYRAEAVNAPGSFGLLNHTARRENLARLSTLTASAKAIMLKTLWVPIPNSSRSEGHLHQLTISGD